MGVLEGEENEHYSLSVVMSTNDTDNTFLRCKLCVQKEKLYTHRQEQDYGPADFFPGVTDQIINHVDRYNMLHDGHFSLKLSLFLSTYLR